MNKRRIALMLIFTIMALVLTVMACESTNSLISPIDTPQPMDAATVAQSTLESGQSQIKALSHQATVISLNKDQAAKVAAQATLDYNQRQLMDLSIQETEISQNMAEAAATQQFITGQTQTILNATATVLSQAVTQQSSIEQTQEALNAAATAQSQAATQQFIAVQNQMAWDATASAQSRAAAEQFITYQTQMAWISTATAQSQDATATYSTYLLNVTQTAQAQALLGFQNATQQAYSLTATPWAAIQSDIVRTRNESIRRSLWGEFVVTPLKVILFTLVVLLLIVGGVMAYRRLIPALEFRLRTIWHDEVTPLLLVDGMIVDPEPPLRRLTQLRRRLLKPPRLASDEIPQVEIIDPTEPSVTNWIAEAEHKLRSDGRMSA